MKARNLLRWVVVFWLLAGYALPSTWWQKGSAEVLIRRALVDAPPCTALLVSAGVFGVVWWTFARDVRLERWASLLWLLLLVLASGYLFDPMGRGYTGTGYLRCAWVLCLLSTGTLCARLLTPVELMAMVVTLAVVQAGYTLTTFAMGQNLFHTHRLARAGGTFGTPVHVYTMMLLALPMCLALLCRLRYDRVWMALGAAAAIMVAALWVTYSRSAWLAVSVVIPMVVYALWARKRLAIALGVALWILLGGMYALRLESSAPLGDTTAQTRVDIWRMGWQTFVQNWLWGVGVDNVRLRYTSTWRGYAVSTWYGAPENQLLLWLCERGIWGGVFAIMLVVAFVQRWRQCQPVYRWGLGGALLAIGVLGMFQSVFGRVEESVETVLVSAIWASALREEVVNDAQATGVLFA
ncbi:MAG: hypothetical protein KatS3mg023_1041 [Armatimonadota bacterium]|nr:MAG: hypothetical protein KatS3mg023_1041 [Armatimonadota bacterium]